jgi:glycerate-2-kinase
VTEEKGLPAVVLTTFLEGEAKDMGMFHAAIAREIHQSGQPVQAPCVILSAGEAVTTIREEVIECHGGPSLEMAVGFVIGSPPPGTCFLSIDTEGSDGTTQVAGGIVDSQTAFLAQKQEIDLRLALRKHSSLEALLPLKGTVMTGNTGTNLCDLNILYVPGKEERNEQ